MPFKYSYNLAPGYLCSNLLQRTNIHDRLTRNRSSLEIPLFKTASGQRSFTYRAVKIWIDLDDSFKLQPSISALDDTHINREAVCLFLHHNNSPLPASHSTFSGQSHTRRLGLNASPAGQSISCALPVTSHIMKP